MAKRGIYEYGNIVVVDGKKKSQHKRQRCNNVRTHCNLLIHNNSPFVHWQICVSVISQARKPGDQSKAWKLWELRMGTCLPAIYQVVGNGPDRGGRGHWEINLNAGFIERFLSVN